MAKNRILIVEDEESLLKLESILISSRGYDVTGVMDGKAALIEVKRKKPDLVLLDVMLPELDGFEVCRRIKEDSETSDIPVIILTAKKTAQDHLRGQQCGCDAYITKPFKSSRVLEAINEILEKKGRAQ